MHPIVSAGAVKIEQHTQQVKRGITFAVQQDIKQFLLYSSVGLRPPPGARLRFAKEFNTVRS